MKRKVVLSLVTLVAACLIYVSLTVAHESAGKEKQDYGAVRNPTPKMAEVAADVEDETVASSDASSDMPDKDYVDGLYAGSAGAFFLRKGDKGGQMIGQAGISVANSLKWYGSSHRFWVYEIEGFKSSTTGKKEYLAFHKGGAGTYATVWLSKTVDNPKDLSSFVFLGIALRGEKQGNMK